MLTQFSSKMVAAGWLAAVAVFVGLVSSSAPLAQQPPAGAPAAPPAQPARGRGPAPTDTLGAGPWDLGAGRGRIHVTAIKGLDHPWGIAFVPDGSMLVTERPGRLRVVRNGVVDPTALGPAPQSLAVGLGGFLDVTLDPQFATNRRIYLAYAKPGTGGGNDATTAVYRARWDGGSTLTEGKDIFVADAYHGAPGTEKLPGVLGPATGSYGTRLVFDSTPASCSSRSAIATSLRSRRIPTRTSARSSASRPTAACRPTTRSSARPATSRRSGRSATATRSGCTSTRSTARCGPPRKDRRAATS